MLSTTRDIELFTPPLLFARNSKNRLFALFGSGICVLFAYNIIYTGARSALAKKSVLFAPSYYLHFFINHIGLQFAHTNYLHFCLVGHSSLFARNIICAGARSAQAKNLALFAPSCYLNFFGKPSFSLFARNIICTGARSAPAKKSV